MKYRPDIDGLRAMACVPIVLYHAGVSLISGGFAGVDIFFVISGFLITKILVAEAQGGSIRVTRFYHRRIVRLLPALLTMILIVLAVTWYSGLPDEMLEYGASAVAATIFLSNFFFWLTTDYFASAAETQPLLHTWSLGVEEQFYILYPAILLFFTRAGSRYLPVGLACLAGLSFLSAAYSSQVDKTSAFYLLHNRAWELAIGAIIAVVTIPQIGGRRGAELLSLLGMALILAGYGLSGKVGAFPAPGALIPCLGAALLIAYAPGTMIGRGLSLPPMVYIGRTSYSLYLWHWPIITLYQLHTGFELELIEVVLLIAASFFAGVLSYHFIEQPFLKSFRQVKTRHVLPVGAMAIVGVAFVTAMAAYGGVTRTLPEQAKQISTFLNYREKTDYFDQFRRGPCFRGRKEKDIAFDPDLCTPLRNDGKNIVVLGDSHAAHFWKAIVLQYPEYGVHQATASGCRPTIIGSGARACREVVDFVLGSLVSTGKVGTLVLSGRWKDKDLTHLEETVERVAPLVGRLIVLGPTMEYHGDAPRYLARSERGVGIDLNQLEDISRYDMDRRMRTLLEDTKADYISVIDTLCPDKNCKIMVEKGVPMQFDYGHFTLDGAKWVVKELPSLLPYAPHANDLKK